MMGFIVCVCYFFMTIVDISTSAKDVPLFSIEALIGETVYLPCNISTQEINDDIELILWYREDKGTPIYSVDIRERDPNAAKRWSDETVFSNRAYFLFDKLPGELAVQNAKDSDTGVYRCRVDFKVAQTRNSVVNLTIIVPPERISIRDESNTERNSVVGPYSEGDTMKLKCDVFGGRPTPNVTWFRDDNLLSSETVLVPSGRHLRSEIVVERLSRQDLNSRFTCKAINHHRATPVEASVQLDMNFAPLNIRLLGAHQHQPLSAGRRYDLLCQSAGSRPPAVITWFRDSERLDRTTETTSSDGNQTTSTLSITLSRSDAGKYLSCKAYNHMSPSEALEDGWRLDIQYIPETTVRLGSSLDPETIREGTDVYFDCIVMAHPAVYKVEWRHNGRMLPHNISQGVIISNISLVLQSVSRTTAGNYSCVGYNAEGDGESLPFELNVMYAPTCAPGQPRVYGVAKQENAQIKCIVDANPPEVDFKWTFNNSAESIDVAASHVSRHGTSSFVSYTPMTELDYGTLLCSATNKIGKQKHPCIFHIIAAGRPDQVHNCTITNISMTSMSIRCSEGFNGGLTQQFMLEVRDSQTSELRANYSSPVPRFTVNSLMPSAIYLASVYAFNSKGRSDPTVVQAAMLRMPEKQPTGEKVLNFKVEQRPRSNLSINPLISIAIGIGAAILIGSCAVILALRITCGRRNRRKDVHQNTNVRVASPGPSLKSVGSKDYDGNESDEKNPDVIPETIDSDDQVEFLKRRQHISTIDTNSPSRLLLASNVTSNNSSFIPSSTIQIHKNHNAIGYCTLRNGSLHGQPQMSATNSMSMSPVPKAFQNPSNTCTLPRHHNNQWPSYGGTIAGVRNMSQTITISGSQPQPPSTIAMHNLGPNARTRMCIGLAEDDPEIPLMLKRESTV
ncbi:CLUMA_CG003227, isoform A [Clunio marinus]|uniref:CLUMA_CG003227, isoform A n=1 Tax=Clunio marinus TaxID=568069 RepID=A0A1J1HNF9_9DIPT|nr:CLUMA_CG003227, isoform A [Clunio marinus]